MSTTLKRVHGYLAEFDSVKELYHAAEKVNEAGYKRWDVHSPFPIHGMDHAMGMTRSKLPWLVFFGGEGLVTRVVGRGKIVIQTRSLDGLKNWLNPRL